MSVVGLEGDGISDVLLSWLHTKDELGYGPSLRMPDTIVYKFGQPVHWYFTSVSGKLKKKNKQNLANVRIEEVFNKRNSELVAYYMSEMAVQGRREKVTAIEYFDRQVCTSFSTTDGKRIMVSSSILLSQRVSTTQSLERYGHQKFASWKDGLILSSSTTKDMVCMSVR